MLAWMDEEALRRTRETGEAWFWSRSRRSSGTRARPPARRSPWSSSATTATATRSSCASARPGPVCHTGSLSCFAPWLWRRVAERAKERPEGSYVAGLLDRRAGRGRPQGRRGGRRGRARRRGRERRAPGRGARRPLVPQLRPARRARPRPGRGRGRARRRRVKHERRARGGRRTFRPRPALSTYSQVASGTTGPADRRPTPCARSRAPASQVRCRLRSRSRPEPGCRTRGSPTCRARGRRARRSRPPARRGCPTSSSAPRGSGTTRANVNAPTATRPSAWTPSWWKPPP